MRILQLIMAGIMASAAAAVLAGATSATAAATTPSPAAPALAPQALAASVTAPPRADGSGSWEWPLSPKPAVVRSFDPPAKPWLSGHRGVDLAASAVDAAVVSPEAGTVSFVGTVVDRPVITIDHRNGLRSSFEPIRSHLAQGTPVDKGELIGTVEAGHCGRDPCLHWGVRRGEEYLNPLSFVTDLRPSVLLPLG